jgi:uncharacterized membrane protein
VRGLEGTEEFLDLNDAGVAVGVDRVLRGAIWSESQGATSLSNRIDPSAGLTVSRAKAINDLGQVVAVGFRTGDVHEAPIAFVLTPDRDAQPLASSSP